MLCVLRQNYFVQKEMNGRDVIKNKCYDKCVISDTYVVMGSDNGLSLINTHTADVTEIYDNMFVPKQIIVVEEKSIAIVRAEKGLFQNRLL